VYITEEAGFSGASSVLIYRKEATEIREEDAPLLRAVHHDCLTNRSRFFVRLQPILDAETGRLSGAEALLRYESDDCGEVPPGRFISFLESDPGYTELGYCIIRESLRHAAKIRKKLPDFNININITALQLYEKDFIRRVQEILKEENYPPEHVILELTERCKEMDFGYLKQQVEELRKAGLRVALDDMGTGFSTIDLLLHLNVNEIKLDMAFTQNMQKNASDEKFAQMLVKIAEENRMLLCFEGVETQEMLDYLRQFGKVLLQGYYFDKPLKAEEFAAKYC
jgi:EAL domain-containing protein (putative c-di-GMP-specific phosphodiesterase class I)